jgi:hypothetical protein
MSLGSIIGGIVGGVESVVGGVLGGGSGGSSSASAAQSSAPALNLLDMSSPMQQFLSTVGPSGTGQGMLDDLVANAGDTSASVGSLSAAASALQG